MVRAVSVLVRLELLIPNLPIPHLSDAVFHPLGGVEYFSLDVS
jgi:hypothetical protein